MNIEIENEIDYIDIRLGAQKIFKKLLNSIDKIVRETINDKKKADALIEKIVISFLDISENEKYEEKEVSKEESFQRRRIQAAARTEKQMQEYRKHKREFNTFITDQRKHNLRNRLLKKSDEIEKKNNGIEKQSDDNEFEFTVNDTINKLMATRVNV